MTFHTAISPDILNFGISFLFVFGIVFSLIVYSKLLPNKEANILIAAAIAISAALYAPFQGFLQQIIPAATAVLIVLFFLVFFNRIITGGKKSRDVVPLSVGLASLLIVLAGIWPRVSSTFGISGISTDTILGIIGLVVVVLILNYAYRLGLGGGAPPAPAGGGNEQ